MPPLFASWETWMAAPGCRGVAGKRISGKNLELLAGGVSGRTALLAVEFREFAILRAEDPCHCEEECVHKLVVHYHEASVHQVHAQENWPQGSELRVEECV